jgi:hypothetical protein
MCDHLIPQPPLVTVTKLFRSGASLFSNLPTFPALPSHNWSKPPRFRAGKDIVRRAALHKVRKGALAVGTAITLDDRLCAPHDRSCILAPPTHLSTSICQENTMSYSRDLRQKLHGFLICSIALMFQESSEGKHLSVKYVATLNIFQPLPSSAVTYSLRS